MPSSQRRPGTHHAHRIAVQLSSTQIFAVRRSQQRRVPHQPGLRRRLPQISPPAKNKHRFLAWFSKRNYQAFVRFAVGSSAALSAIALNWPAFWNLSLGAGSRSENSGLHPRYPLRVSTGPATLDRRCGRNVVA